MRKFIVFTSLLIILTSCQTVQTIKGPDGTPHELITCASTEDCYSEATQVCGGKYQIVNTSSEVASFAGSATQSNVKLLVKCLTKATYEQKETH